MINHLKLMLIEKGTIKIIYLIQNNNQNKNKNKIN
jgi:hypothetical protein